MAFFHWAPQLFTPQVIATLECNYLWIIKNTGTKVVPNSLIPAERHRVWIVIRGRRTPPVQRQHRRRCLGTLYRNLCSANTSRGGGIVSARWKGGWVRLAAHSFFLRRLWKAAPWLCRNPELATPVWTSIRRNFAPWKWNFRVDSGGLIKKRDWWCFVASSGVKWRRKLFWDDRVVSDV